MSFFTKAIFKVIDKIVADASTRNLEKGRLILIVDDNGKVRMKAGVGDKKPSQLNYIGDSYYSSPNPTTIELGGIAKSSILQDKSSDEILQMMLEKYLTVELSSLSTSINQKEIGDPMSGSISLTCQVTNSSNLRDVDKAFIDSTILNNSFFNPLVTTSFNLNGFVSNVIQSIPIKVTIYGKKGESSSRTVHIPYRAKMYWGSSELPVLSTKSQVQALQNNNLISSRQGTFTLPAGYPYIVIPKVIPLSGIGFTDIDVNTGKELFSYAMIRQSDLQFSNGFINVDHAVYRAENYMTGTTKCKIS